MESLNLFHLMIVAPFFIGAFYFTPKIVEATPNDFLGYVALIVSPLVIMSIPIVAFLLVR